MANIKDVARLAGVSVATVSRTLDGSPKVTDATRARVLEAVAACGYVTNALARNFRQRRTHTVLVLVPDIANPFFSLFVLHTTSSTGIRKVFSIYCMMVNC